MQTAERCRRRLHYPEKLTFVPAGRNHARVDLARGEASCRWDANEADTLKATGKPVRLRGTRSHWLGRRFGLPPEFFWGCGQRGGSRDHIRL